MIFTLLIVAATMLLRLYIAIIPSIDLPAGLLSAISYVGTCIAYTKNFVPNGTFENAAAALAFVAAVHFIVIPFIAARNFKIPILHR